MKVARVFVIPDNRGSLQIGNNIDDDDDDDDIRCI
jgi:hypothetical protein